MQSLVLLSKIIVLFLFCQVHGKVVDFEKYGGIAGYTQAWLRGEGPVAHCHEGIRLADKSGWVGIGETLSEGLFRRSEVEKINRPPKLNSVFLGPGETCG